MQGVGTNNAGGVRLGRGHEFEMMDPDAEDFRLAVSGRSPIPMPERRLREAILLDAVDVLQKGKARYERLRHDPYDKGTTWRRDYCEARAWVASTSHEEPFGFVPLCEVLGLDPAAARAEILAGMPVIPLEPAVVSYPPFRSSRSKRLWAWAAEQERAWTSHEAADALRENVKRIVGLVSHWVRDGRLIVVCRPYGKSQRGASTYRLAKREAA